MMQRLNSTKDMGNEPRNKIQEHSNDDLEEDAFFHCQRPSVSLKQTPQDLYTATSLSSYPNKTADNHVKQIFTRPEGKQPDIKLHDHFVSTTIIVLFQVVPLDLNYHD